METRVPPVNPYQSPRSSAPSELDGSLALPVLPESRWNEVAVRVVPPVRGRWTRQITLTGSIDADLAYDAASFGERVYLNGQLIATTSAFYWSIWATVTPRIDFHLEVERLGHAVPARIDVAASFWRLCMISAFRLTIAGKIVYEE